MAWEPCRASTWSRRRARHQARDRRLVDPEDATDLRLRLVSVEQFERMRPLMRRELRLTTEPYALRLGPLAAGRRARTDQLALEFGEPAEDRHHQPAVRIAGVGPGVGQTLERSATLGDGA